MSVSLKGLTLQYNNRSEENQLAGWSIPSDWAGVRGGVSSTANGPLAWGRGEDSSIIANRIVWAAQRGFASERVVSLDQVHEATILHVTRERCGSGFLNPQTRFARADGMLTTDSNVVLVTSHADCAPIFLYSAEKRAISLIHAGWRGTLKGIAGAAVRKLVDEFAVAPSKLRVAIGPMIDTHNYPVGEDVAALFSSTFGPQVISMSADRPHLDLFAAITVDLLRAGVAEHNLHQRPPSTFMDSHWSSYRRDGTNTGGMLAFFTLN